MSVTGSRLRQLRMKSGKSQDEVAKILKISRPAYVSYETGRSKPSRKLTELSKLFNVSADYIMGLTDNPAPTTFAGQDGEHFFLFAGQQEYMMNLAQYGLSSIQETVKPLPIVGTIACGTPILAQENIDGYTYIDRKCHATFALRAKGDSMIGKRINDGDIVFIQQTEDVDDGEIAAVLIDGEATLKIVHRKGNTLILSPANNEYSPLVYQDGEADSVRILGKAVGFSAKL